MSSGDRDGETGVQWVQTVLESRGRTGERVIWILNFMVEEDGGSTCHFFTCMR